MSKKHYTVLESQGCTAFYTDIDGKTITGEGAEEIQDPERFIASVAEHVKQSVLKCNTPLEAIQILSYTVDSDAYETDDHCCDQCGDSVSRETWKVPKISWPEESNKVE